MGNRAVITTEEKKVGIYLHWNGGRDSVEAFLHFCKVCQFRRPEDDEYSWAALTTVIANYLWQPSDTVLNAPSMADYCTAGLSIGTGFYEDLPSADFDNGTYIIKDWRIVGRENHSGSEQDTHPFDEMIQAIYEAQPFGIQRNYDIGVRKGLADNKPVMKVVA